MNDLLPCPFCGGEAEIIESDYGMYLTGYAIYCGKCCLKLGVTGRLGEAYEWSPVFDTEAEAIAAWNTRYARTCRNDSLKRGAGVFVCSECEVYLDIADMDWDGEDDSGGFYEPRYCPNCGAKVVGE